MLPHILLLCDVFFYHLQHLLFSRNRNSKFFDEIETDEYFFLNKTYYVRIKTIIYYKFSILTFFMINS